MLKKFRLCLFSLLSIRHNLPDVAVKEGGDSF